MDRFILLLASLGDLVLYISLIIYFFQDRKIYTYVKGIFLTSFFLLIIRRIILILSYTFNIYSVQKIFFWEGNFVFIQSFLNATPYFLLVFGASLLIGKDYLVKDEKIEYPTMEGKRRNIGVSLLLFIVTLGIYFPFWLYRTVKDLKNNFEDDIRYTPGKAVGFFFIPIFNIFWAFYILFSLPFRIKQIESKYYGENIGFYFHPLLIPILLIIFIITVNLQINFELDKDTFKYIFGDILFFESAIIILWLTIQAKLNSFFDSKKSQL